MTLEWVCKSKPVAAGAGTARRDAGLPGAADGLCCQHTGTITDLGSDKDLLPPEAFVCFSQHLSSFVVLISCQHNFQSRRHRPVHSPWGFLSYKRQWIVLNNKHTEIPFIGLHPNSSSPFAE